MNKNSTTPQFGSAVYPKGYTPAPAAPRSIPALMARMHEPPVYPNHPHNLKTIPNIKALSSLYRAPTQ